MDERPHPQQLLGAADSTLGADLSLSARPCSGNSDRIIVTCTVDMCVHEVSDQDDDEDEGTG